MVRLRVPTRRALPRVLDKDRVAGETAEVVGGPTTVYARPRRTPSVPAATATNAPKGEGDGKDFPCLGSGSAFGWGFSPGSTLRIASLIVGVLVLGEHPDVV